MRIIKIEPYENGAHDNNSSEHIKVVPEGWAKIPDDMETPNFPFGDIKVKKINGVMTVTEWIPRDIPEPEETEQPPTEMERLRADIDFIAAMTGVEL